MEKMYCDECKPLEEESNDMKNKLLVELEKLEPPAAVE